MSKNEIFFSVFDTETTGLDPKEGARVLEIGVSKVDIFGNEVAKFNTLLNPGDDVDLGPTEIHGVTRDMLSGAPTFAEIAGDLFSVFENSILVAHNAPFDTKFLINEFYKSRLNWPKPIIIDTLAPARFLLPNVANHKLATLAEHFNIKFEGPAHSAYADAFVTGKLFASLNSMVKRESESWPDASKISWPTLPTTGKFKTR
jgi:DNA polymerase-3 subunit epsilon